MMLLVCEILFLFLLRMRLLFWGFLRNFLDVLECCTIFHAMTVDGCKDPPFHQHPFHQQFEVGV